MKILLPYLKRFDESTIYDNTIVPGGVELFSRLVYENFEDVIPVEFTRADQQHRKVTTKIVREVVTHNPDIMICNYNSTSLTKRVWEYTKIPILWINHNNCGGFSTPQLLDYMREFMKRQPYLAFVSQFQIETYKNRAKFDFGSPLVINPCFARANVKPATEFNQDAITVSRMDKIKDPFWLSRVYNGPYKIFTTSSTLHGDYSQKFNNYHKHLHYDYSHAAIMDELRKSKVYVSTCPSESWGIGALEALERGVPLILRANKESHASKEISPNPEFYRLVKNKISSDEMQQHIDDLCKLDRQQIITETYKYHSRQRWIDNLKHALNLTILTYTP